MIVVWILAGVIIAAILLLGFCAIRMAGFVARDERAGLIPQPDQNVGIEGESK